MVRLTKKEKGFEAAWKPIQFRFPMLTQFLGGLGTVFPGTLSVKADFYLLEWSKDDFSVALINFSLEGILHAKQFQLLQNLYTNLKKAYTGLDSTTKNTSIVLNILVYAPLHPFLISQNTHKFVMPPGTS